MSLTVRHKVSLSYAQCDPITLHQLIHPDVLGTWAVALHTPCKPSRSWRSLPACPPAPPRHRPLTHAQTHTLAQNQKPTQKSHIHTYTRTRMHIFIYKHECMHARYGMQVYRRCLSILTWLRQTLSRTHTHICRHPRACLPPCSSIVPLEDCAPFH